MCWSDCETSVEKSARFTYIIQMSLAFALAAHIEELPGRKVHLSSIVKQNEGCMYIQYASKKTGSNGTCKVSNGNVTLLLRYSKVTGKLLQSYLKVT